MLERSDQASDLKIPVGNQFAAQSDKRPRRFCIPCWRTIAMDQRGWIFRPIAFANFFWRGWGCWILGEGDYRRKHSDLLEGSKIARRHRPGVTRPTDDSNRSVKIGAGSAVPKTIGHPPSAYRPRNLRLRRPHPGDLKLIGGLMSGPILNEVATGKI